MKPKKPFPQNLYLLAPLYFLLALLHHVAHAESSQPLSANSQEREAQIALAHKRYTTAYPLYSALAKQQEQKNPDIFFTLAQFYQEGWGQRKDLKSACLWFLKSAIYGHTEGMHAAGQCFENNIISADEGLDKLISASSRPFTATTPTPLPAPLATSRSQTLTTLPPPDARERLHHTVMANASAAITWYSKAAEAGNLKAYCSLGLMYAQGKAVQKDTDHALRLCLKSAQRGVVNAQLAVANLLMKNGIRQNFALAAHWYEQAALGGNGEAAYALAELYHGHPGAFAKTLTLKDFDRESSMLYWYETAGALGYEPAYAKIAVTYFDQFERSEDTEDSPNAKLLAKAYLWLRASVIAYEAHVDSALFQHMGASMEPRLTQITPKVPQHWLPELEAEIAAHFTKNPIQNDQMSIHAQRTTFPNNSVSLNNSPSPNHNSVSSNNDSLSKDPRATTLNDLAEQATPLSSPFPQSLSDTKI